MAEAQQLPDVIKPFAPDGYSDRTMRVTLNFVALTIVECMAKSDQRTPQQWLSRFLVQALNDKFREDAERIQKERKHKETSDAN